MTFQINLKYPFFIAWSNSNPILNINSIVHSSRSKTINIETYISFCTYYGILLSTDESKLYKTLLPLRKVGGIFRGTVKI